MWTYSPNQLVISYKHYLLTLTMHFITCIWTIGVTVTAETGKNALTRCTAEVIIIWTRAITFITEVTTVIHLVASLVTWHTAIVVALEVARSTRAQSCEYFAHFTCEVFMTVVIPKVACLIMTLCSLVGGNQLFREHTISIFRAQDGGISFFRYTRVHSVLTQHAITWIVPHVYDTTWLPYTLNTLSSN